MSPLLRRRRRLRRRQPPLHQNLTHEQEQEEDGSYPANSQQYDPDDIDIADEDGQTDRESSYPPANSSANSAWSPPLSQSANSITPHTYINIAPLPIFRGRPEECPVAHLSRFSRVCRANNASTVDMMTRVFPVTLDDEAALWYELNVEPYPFLPWEDIKSSFLKTYRRAEFLDQSELMMIRQGEHETVNAFYLRMQWILKKWPDHSLPDLILKGIFVDGLREDFQDWIIPQRPDSLEEALNLALSWEQAQSIRAARRRQNNAAAGDFKCGFCDGSHEEKTCQIRQRMKELWMRKSKEMPDSSLVKTGDGEKEGGGVVPGDGLRFLSPSASMVRRSQCQCWKHQCWKRFERSNSSLQVRNQPAAAAAEATAE